MEIFVSETLLKMMMEREVFAAAAEYYRSKELERAIEIIGGSAVALAGMLGLHRNTIGKWRTGAGNISWENAINVAKICNEKAGYKAISAKVLISQMG